MYNQRMPAANRLLVMEEGDRSECDRIVGSRKTAVSITKRAQMLVLAAGGLSNRRIALELGANEHVVGRVRKEYGVIAESVPKRTLSGIEELKARTSQRPKPSLNGSDGQT